MKSIEMINQSIYSITNARVKNKKTPLPYSKMQVKGQNNSLYYRNIKYFARQS